MKLTDGRVGASQAGEAYGGAIYVDQGNVTLTDMELSSNVAINEAQGRGFGGGVFCGPNSGVIFSRVFMHNNTAPNGAAVASDFCTLSIGDSQVTNNNGSGIYAFSVTMSGSTVSNNQGVGVTAEFMTIADSRITGNQTGLAGGDSKMLMTVERCVISDNSPRGGLVNSGLAHIRDTVLKNNRNISRGGGISNTGSLYIRDSSIVGNRATQSGGGILTAIGHLFLTNSTVSGNVAGSSGSPGMVGGGIHNLYNFANTGGRSTITNSTIANNQSTGTGGGLTNDIDGIATIRNTIISGNSSTLTSDEDVFGTFSSEGTNLIRNRTGSSGWVSSDLLDLDPLLAPVGNNGNNTFTHALLPGSPAIDAGNNFLAIDPETMTSLTNDQRGFQRISGIGKYPVVDIGAYEAFYSAEPVLVSGRITTAMGRGVDRARLILTDIGNGTALHTITNTFGYFRILNLIPGRTYSISISHKSHSFDSPQNFTVDQNRSDLNFIADL
jgi:hypothetical protein